MRTSFSDSARNFLLVGVFQHPFRAHGRRERPFCSVMDRLLLFIVLFIIFEFADAGGGGGGLLRA